ncbi:hypothetical protein NPIL_307431 [Nephila pilipes]|uniref:Uncharacterized protein n=1 Tax=Nephila pilipes TaxID=299642 RepID=A0A8X6MMI5_NEPPI|nr:hypothetical protein NPIL_307431 [Nephila pilipes]
MFCSKENSAITTNEDNTGSSAAYALREQNLLLSKMLLKMGCDKKANVTFLNLEGRSPPLLGAIDSSDRVLRDDFSISVGTGLYANVQDPE